jgi:hypothetical protein
MRSGSRKKANQDNFTLGLEAAEAEENSEKEMMVKAGQWTRSKPWCRRTK